MGTFKPQPHDGSGESDERGEAFGESIVASRDAPKWLDAAEETFDEIAVFLPMLMKRTLGNAMAAGWNDGFNAFGVQMFEDRVGVVGSIHAERATAKVLQQPQSVRIIACLAASESKSGPGRKRSSTG